MEPAIPEEDKWLKKEQASTTRPECVHEWCDLYAGAGSKRGDINTALVAFFCKKCLKIRVKSYDRSEYTLYDGEGNEIE